MTYPHSTPIYLANTPIEKVIAWTTDQFGSPGTTPLNRWDLKISGFSFKYEEDEILFRLRWL